MTRRIVIIDKEYALLDSAQNAFSHAGYEVSTHTATAEALSEWEEGQRLACLIIDREVSGKGTKRLIEEARKRDETLPIVITSRGTEAEVADVMEPVGMTFVHKPFRMINLLEAVSEAIESVGRGEEA